MIESIPKIYLSTLVDKLEVLDETILDFDNLEGNGFDLSSDVAIQVWEVYFNKLKVPFNLALVKYFWIYV